MVTAQVWSPRASKRTQFGESICSSSVSSIATIRSSVGMSSVSALRSVVLPLPVPPLNRILRRVWRVRSAASRLCSGSVPCSTSCAAEKDRFSNRRTVIATCGLAGGTQIATRDPSAQARIEDRHGGRVQPEGPGDMNRRPFELRRVQRGRVDLV